MTDSPLSASDVATIRAAVVQLENPGLAAKLAAAIGLPVEKLLSRLPNAIQGQVTSVTEKSLAKALQVALTTLDARPPDAPWNVTHKIATTLTGVTGGFFGAPALIAELPVTTVIMLRSIADIARSKGEDLSDPAARLACLEVFALGDGGRDVPDAAVDAVQEECEASEAFLRASYFATRAALAQQVSAAVKTLARGGATEGSSALTKLIARIAARFGLAVSEKAAAQAVPIIGAVGGGLVNALFTDHFQDTAEAHFSIRKLERLYGPDVVRAQYEQIVRELRGQSNDVQQPDHPRLSLDPNSGVAGSDQREGPDRGAPGHPLRS